MSAMPLNADEMAEVFGYANKRGVNRAIRLGTFPIPTYTFEGRRYAHPEHVQGWLNKKKAEAEEEWDSWVEEDEDD